MNCGVIASLKLDAALDANLLTLQHSILQHVADGHVDFESATDAIDASAEYHDAARRDAIDKIDHLLDGMKA